MDITLTPMIRQSARHATGKGFYVFFVEGELVKQPSQNFRRSERGAVALINQCVNNYAGNMRKFGNTVTVLPVEILRKTQIFGEAVS